MHEVLNILKSIDISQDIVEFKLSSKARREFGSLGSIFGRQIHRVCNLAQSGYRAPNICQAEEESYCKTATASLSDLFVIILKHLKDERVILDKQKKEYVLTTELTNEEIREELLSIKIQQYKEFVDSGCNIEDYKETSCGRIYHPIQNEKKSLRNAVVKHFGFTKDVDVKSCMPSIMLQHVLDEVYDYNTIDDIAKETGIERHIVKKWINSRFYKGRPESIKSEVFKDFQHDWKILTNLKLKTCKKYRDLVKKINKVNRIVKEEYCYFKLERLVTNCFYDFINARGGRTILIHDGFYTDIDFSLKELEYYIQEKTGFQLKLDQEVL